MIRIQWLFVAVLVLVYSVQGKDICNVEDEICMTKLGQKAFKLFVAGIQDVINPIDPLYIEKIDGSLGTLLYQLRNVTMTGLKECEITYLRYDKKRGTYKHDLQCPKLVFNYFYEIKGSLGNEKLDGMGLGEVTADNYHLTLKGYFKEFISEIDQKPHITIKHHSLETNLKGKLTFKNVSTSSGNPALATLVESFLNDTYQLIERLLRKPVFEKFMEVYIKVIDAYLKYFPIDEVFLSD